jgi:hypothetical protein
MEPRMFVARLSRQSLTQRRALQLTLPEPGLGEIASLEAAPVQQALERQAAVRSPKILRALRAMVGFSSGFLDASFDASLPFGDAEIIRLSGRLRGPIHSCVIARSFCLP